jgi:predicted NBD/HSP70 family sugar kinase
MLEEQTGASAVMRDVRSTGLRPARSPKSVFAAAARGSADAAAVVRREADRIALAIAAVAPVLDPELVILGGGIGSNPDLLAPVDARLREISPFRPRLATTQLGADAVLHGAVSTALQAAQDQLFTRKPLSRIAVI